MREEARSGGAGRTRVREDNLVAERLRKKKKKKKNKVGRKRHRQNLGGMLRILMKGQKV